MNCCKGELRIRLDFWKDTLQKLRAAYVSLLEGGVKSYTIDDRQLTKFDIPDLLKQIKEAEKQVDELCKKLKGIKSRKAFGIIPRDW